MGEELFLKDDHRGLSYPKTRVNLIRLRKKLKAFYESTGYADETKIVLPQGSFVPTIAFS